MTIVELLRNTDHRWNAFYMAFFVAIALVFGWIIYNVNGYFPRAISLFDFVILSLASFRLVRLFTYDKVTLFVREYFLSATPGPRKAAGELLNCPWCFGVWAATFAIFFYYTVPIAWYALLILAVSGVGSFIQLIANQVGWRAEKLKLEVSKLS